MFTYLEKMKGLFSINSACYEDGKKDSPLHLFSADIFKQDYGVQYQRISAEKAIHSIVTPSHFLKL